MSVPSIPSPSVAPLPRTALAALFAALAAPWLPAATAVLDWDAARDPDGGTNATWEHVGTADPFNWNLQGGVSFVGDAGSSLPGITSTYRFPGGPQTDATGRANLQSSFDGFAGFDASMDATFEVWFRPSLLTGTAVIADFGGNVDGSSITVNEGVLQFASKDNTTITAGLSYDLAPLGVAEFIQAVGAIDLANNQLRLFVNGAEVPGSPADFTGDTNDFSGGDGHGLGGRNGGNTGASETAAGAGPIFGFMDNYDNFTGDIAILRAYQEVLTAADVAELYAGVAVPEPAASLLLALAAAGALARRRRGEGSS